MANYVFPRMVYQHHTPGPTDDANQGYVVGQPWANLATERYWICIRNTPGDAWWLPLGAVTVVNNHEDLDPGTWENLLVYCETYKQVFYSDGDKWMLVTFDITKVTTFPDPTNIIWDNKLIFFIPTEDIYYCDGSKWILLTWRIHNREWLPVLPDNTMVAPQGVVSYWEGKLCFQTTTKSMHYCYEQKWYSMGVTIVNNYEDLIPGEWHNLLVYCETTKQVYYSDGDKWMLVTFDIIKVPTLPPVSWEYDNKIVYDESTKQVYYCDGDIWILLSWKIYNVSPLPNPTEFWEGKMAFETNIKKMYYCYNQIWYGVGWSKGHDFNFGSSTFAGNNATKTIAHGLPTTPGNVTITPHGNPNGYLGEIWYTATSANILVGNSGSYTGAFRWFAISNDV